MRLLTLLILTPLILTACTPTSSPSPTPSPSNANLAAASKPSTCLGIVDGAATSAYPSVWEIFAPGPQSDPSSGLSCSGTFVSDNTLFTASHCMPCDGSPVYLVTNQNIQNNGALANLTSNTASLSYVLGAPSACGDKGVSDLTDLGTDFAVVIFPNGTGTSGSAVSKATRPTGTAVNLVGFGFKSTTDTSLSKAVGSNTLAAALAVVGGPGTYLLTGPATPTGATSGVSLTADGDSGGPLFDASDQVLIGTVVDGNQVSINGVTEGVSIYTDVTSPTSTALIAQAVTKGARITYETQTTSPLPTTPPTSPLPPTPPTSPLPTTPSPLSTPPPLPTPCSP